jgi:hypothetical protein
MRKTYRSPVLSRHKALSLSLNQLMGAPAHACRGFKDELLREKEFPKGLSTSAKAGERASPAPPKTLTSVAGGSVSAGWQRSRVWNATV